MDVRYIPADWDQMKSSLGDLIRLGRWGKGMIDDLKNVTRNMQNVKSDIDRYDTDGVVSFHHIDRESNYQELFEIFNVTHKYTGNVGDIVDRTIDQPFYEDNDAFVAAMQQATISNYTTGNRLGITEEQTIHYGQGVKETQEVPKTEVSLDDLLGGDNFYAEQISIEYDMWKAENPDQDFPQEEYRMAAVNMNVFEYDSIEDQQLNKEFWVNIGAMVTIVGATVLAVVAPPVGVPLAITLGATYGTLEMGTAISGKDWISGRELGSGERALRGGLSVFDLLPGVASIKRFGTGVRLGSQTLDTGKLAAKPGLRTTFKMKWSM